jgi:hypothetical protein
MRRLVMLLPDSDHAASVRFSSSFWAARISSTSSRVTERSQLRGVCEKVRRRTKSNGNRNQLCALIADERHVASLRVDTSLSAMLITSDFDADLRVLAPASASRPSPCMS